MSATFELFPLRETTVRDLEDLCKVLWEWSDCALCDSQNPCAGTPGCSWHRFKRLTSFFNYYRAETKRHIPEISSQYPQALRNHADLRRIIGLLRNNPDEPLSHLTNRCFNADGTTYSSPPITADQRRAFSLALQIMSMVTVPEKDSYVANLDAALLTVVWSNNVSPAQYLEAILQGQSHTGGVVSYGAVHRPAKIIEVNRILESLKARRLRKVGKLEFEATDSLNDHLRLDKKSGVVKLFRHTAFLKEQLFASRSTQNNTTPSLFGTRISRQYAREVLHSIQDVLFPPDAKSQLFLRSLINKQEMDPDCTLYNGSEYELEGEDEVTYQWLGPRLRDLHEELENPSPRGMLDRWLEHRSRARHVMLATVIGVFAAVILGVLSLIVGIIQTYIAWEQWKHPPGNGL
ncbi:hypothetical protein PG995_006515 [Apiospora arundinis]